MYIYMYVTYFPHFDVGRRLVEDTERILSAESSLELDSVGSLSMFAQSISNLQKIEGKIQLLVPLWFTQFRRDRE